MLRQRFGTLALPRRAPTNPLTVLYHGMCTHASEISSLLLQPTPVYCTLHLPIHPSIHPANQPASHQPSNIRYRRASRARKREMLVFSFETERLLPLSLKSHQPLDWLSSRGGNHLNPTPDPPDRARYISIVDTLEILVD